MYILISGRKPSILSHLYCDHDTSTLSRSIRNALIYGTLCRHKMVSSNQKSAPGLAAKKTIDQDNDQSLAADAQNDKITEASISCARNKLNCLRSFNCDKNNVLVKGGSVPKGGLGGYRDERPSVWQLYYGIKAEGSKRYGDGNPSDVPVFVSRFFLIILDTRCL